MKPRFLALGAIALLCSAAPAQTYTLPAACASFNANPGGAPALITLCNASMSTAFVATSAFAATHVDLYLVSPPFMISLVNTTTGTGSALTNVTPGLGVGWTTTALSTPVAFAPGDNGVVNAVPIPQPGWTDTLINVGTNPAGTTPLAMTRSCGSPCTTFGPPCVTGTTMEKLMLRLRGPGCGIPAIVNTGGLGCGAGSPWLTAGGPVVVGQQWGVDLLSATPSGVPAYLFVAEGSITAGTPVEGGHPCRTYLDLASFATLYAFGYEPLMTATIDGGNQAAFPILIPNVPALAGVNFTLQAVIIDPSGIPLQTVPGVSMKASNALHVQIGP